MDKTPQCETQNSESDRKNTFCTLEDKRSDWNFICPRIRANN